jgi:hypothetical protein
MHCTSHMYMCSSMEVGPSFSLKLKAAVGIVFQYVLQYLCTHTPTPMQLSNSKCKPVQSKLHAGQYVIKPITL